MKRQSSGKQNQACQNFSNASENGLHLTRTVHLQRHHDRRIELPCERFDIFSRLVVVIGNRKFGAERPKSLGTTPGDRILIGDANDKASFTFEKLDFCCWNTCHSDLGSRPAIAEHR